MKAKTVTRYQCEFCGKVQYRAANMQRHEERCTMNPNRVCGCCQKLLEQAQPDLQLLIAMLPDAPQRPSGKYGELPWTYEQQDSITVQMSEILPQLRKAASYCPVCIMAALKQNGFPPSWAEDFYFNDELRACWGPINEAALER